MGTNPDLSALQRNNLPEQHDYRQVYGTLLKDWMEASDEAMTATRFTEYAQPGMKLPLVGGTITANEQDRFINERYYLKPCYPNPARGLINLSYRINHTLPVTLTIVNLRGSVVKQVVNERQHPGEYQYAVDVSYLDAGTYLYRLQAGSFQAARKLVVY